MYHYTIPITDINKEDVEILIQLAIKEDAPEGDITSENIFSREHIANAELISRTEGIFCGNKISLYLIEIYNQLTGYRIQIIESLKDGEAFSKSTILMKLKGEVPGLLRIERILLNFVQYLSGISTLTYQTVLEAKKINPNIYILDTRKTLPGYRKLAKYAVYCGGGYNHRIHLSDMVMIKDNHIAVSEGLTAIVNKIRSHTNKPIEIEIDSLDQVEEAILCQPHAILLDNMTPEEIALAIKKILEISHKNNFNVPKIEISGGWRPEDLHLLKNIDYPVGISMGFLTHSARFLDISMEILT